MDEVVEAKVEEEKFSTFQLILIGLIVLLFAFNQYQLYKIPSGAIGRIVLSGDPMKDAIAIVIPTGTPKVYGNELGVSFDVPIESIEVLSTLDPAYGSKKIQLSGAELQRYIKIGTIPTIACEFCCGAKTLVTSAGKPTCGCEHSWAMRGLLAYLIQDHPEMSDDEIIVELARWKGLFFPKDMVNRFLQETQSGKYTADIAALLSVVDKDKLNLEALDTLSAPSNLQNLPQMVGGC